MTEGVELYLRWVNLCLTRDSLNEVCVQLYDAYIKHRAWAIYNRVQQKKEKFKVILSDELERDCIGPAEAAAILELVTGMLKNDDVEEAQDASLRWSLEHYDQTYEKWLEMDDVCFKLSTHIIRLHMMRGIWKQYLLRDDLELLEAFTSSKAGLVALGMDEMVGEKFTNAQRTLQCYRNSEMCRNCFKRPPHKRGKMCCKKCRAVWFCNMKCCVASQLDNDTGHMHECGLLQKHAE